MSALFEGPALWPAIKLGSGSAAAAGAAPGVGSPPPAMAPLPGLSPSVAALWYEPVLQIPPGEEVAEVVEEQVDDPAVLSSHGAGRVR